MANQKEKKDAVATISKTYDLEKPIEAVQMATLLKNIVVQQKLYVSIKGRNYAMVDGWQMAGLLLGLNVMVDEPKNLSTDKEIKYAATAKLYKGEKLVGVGYAVCSSKEAIKKTFEEYAILSMSQTRAIGKAYRNKIGFIMKLAGFQPTPSEEMHNVGEVPPEPTIEMGVAEPKPKQEDGVCAGVRGQCAGTGKVTQAEANYSMKIYKKPLCRACQELAKTPWKTKNKRFITGKLL